MKKSIIIYSSTDGHTKTICLYIKSIIKIKYSTKVISLNKISKENLDDYELIIIGASIRYGKHKKELYKFINQQEKILNDKPNAFFSVNVVARKKGKDTVDNNPYIKKFLSLTSWKPKYLDVFAGRIIYSKYNLIDKLLIILIMWISKGPTNTSQVHEFTDWKKIKEFANTFIN